MSRIFNILSIAAITLLIMAITGIFVSYTLQIERPMQGGWDLYRVREFAPQILPYVFLLVALVVTRARSSRWLFYFGLTLIILSSGYLCALLFAVALQMHQPRTLIAASLLLVLIGGHLAYLAKRGSLAA